jgi:hypothetical protein
MGFTCLALLLFTATALAGQKDLGESGRNAACERMIHLSEEAEKQLGGTLYSGPLPEQGEEAAAMSGMEMKMPKEKEGMQMSGKMPGKEMKMPKEKEGMQMSGKMSGKEMKMPKEKEGMQMSGKMPGKEMKLSEEKGGMQMAGAMPGMEGAHMEHEAKVGGTFFMAPNKMHHLEATYSKECGFQLYLYNAFTRPINVNRFRAFIKVVGEVDGEEDEFFRFLEPNKPHTTMQNLLDVNLTASFEIEMHLKFPESEEVELFNFSVDEQGKIM